MASSQHSTTSQAVRQIRDALTAMRDEGDRPGFYEEAADALAALNSLFEQLEATEGKLAGSRFCVERLQEQVEALRNFNEATRAAYATLNASGISSDLPEAGGAGPGPLGSTPNPASEPR